MVITIGFELEAALRQRARQEVMAPETLALNALRQRFLQVATPEPRDEWERRLLALAKDCSVSLPNAALRREALYD